MSGAEEALVLEEVARALESRARFVTEGRVVGLAEVRGLVQEDPTCGSLAEYFGAKGFLVAEQPITLSSGSKSPCPSTMEADMAEVSRRLGQRCELPPRTQTDFRSFCVATLMWLHRLGPGSVRELRVREWLGRRPEGEAVILTLPGKTVSLSRKEEEWLECYYRHIRPLCLRARAPGAEDKGCFFLGASGLPLTNPSQDVLRLKAKYVKRQPAPPATTAAMSSPPAPASASPPAALSQPPAPPGEERPSTSGLQPPPLPPPRYWGAFQDKFPVGLGGKPPSRAEAAAIGFTDHGYYHHWRGEQLGIRTRHLLERCSDRKGRKPSLARVQSAIRAETAWTTGVPTVDGVLAEWELSRALSAVTSDQQLVMSVVQQSWKGLEIQTVGDKGGGVVTTMPFKKGEIICDYHGEELSHEEGLRRREALPRVSSSYMYFFKGLGGRTLCLDAQSWPCPCHPGMETFGRLMNHSRHRNNVRPFVKLLTLPQGPRECVLFRALRDISMGEELLLDYGVRRGSFRGEGKNLDWLDDWARKSH